MINKMVQIPESDFFPAYGKIIAVYSTYIVVEWPCGNTGHYTIDKNSFVF